MKEENVWQRVNFKIRMSLSVLFN